jgi:hypothetical protein
MFLDDLMEKDGFAVSRRSFLRFSLGASAGALATGMLSPWRLARADDGTDKEKKYVPGKTHIDPRIGKTLEGGGKCKAVIMLYMAGGPSHIDTWDPKPGRDVNGPYKTIDAGDGLLISEHLPTIASQGKHLCILRTVNSKEGSHDRAAYFLRTGYRPQGPVEFPGLGALVAKEKGHKDLDLPQNIAIAGNGPGGGIIGARYAPFVVGDPTRPVDNMGFAPGVDGDRFSRRAKLLKTVEDRFKEDRDGGHLAEAHREVYEKAERLLTSPLAKVFDVAEESEEKRKAYGMGRFGQGVLMARRLVEAGVPFVEVTLGGWDTHQQNFERVEKLSSELDPAMGNLIKDLADKNLLDSTLVVCGGEFGRTPKIRDGGRDHHPRCFSVALAGGGIQGGRAVGVSDENADSPKERPIAIPDIHATIAHLAGYDPNKQNESPLGRPIRIVDPIGAPIGEALV